MPHISPRLIGLVGDVHGNINVAVNAITALAARGITEVHFLGDFGFMWADNNAAQLTFKRLRLALKTAGMTALVTGGNHENYDLLLAIVPDTQGIRWMRHNIGLLPRGWRSVTETGVVTASLGGANSIDRFDRRPGYSWWEQEQITEKDLAALGSERVDVLLGHDSPMSAALHRRLLPSAKFWSPQGLRYSDMGQQMFHRGFIAVSPRLAVGGHYHLHLDTTERFTSDSGKVFETNIVILDADGESFSVAVLDTDTLEIDYLNNELRLEQIRVRRVRD
jgi:hypothetical protein